MHLVYKQKVELADLTDITEKDAAGYLRKVVEFWDRLNVRQEELSVQPTSIYWCTSVIFDNTSVNTGHVKGLVALLERVREHAYALLADPKPPYSPTVFKGCDDHIAGIIYTTFDRALVQYFANDPAMSYLRHPKKTGKGFIFLVFHYLKRLSKRLLGVLRPEWSATKLEADRFLPPRRPKAKMVSCSFNRFCTFGVVADSSLWYANCIRPLLKPDTDALLLDWQVDPIIQFSSHVLQGVSSQFECPLLKASHQLGNVSSTGYQAWLRNLLVLVNQWTARPELVVSNSVVYGSIVLDFTQLTICRILVDSLKHTVKTHFMLFLEMKVPTLIRGTNRWGESVFHYMRMLLDRCPHMRMHLIAAWVQCHRSSYRDEVASEDLVAHRKRGRERLADPELSVMRFSEVMLGKLLHENANKRAKLEKLAMDQQLLQHLQMVGLVPQVQGKVTKAVLTRAIKQYNASGGKLRVTGKKQELRERLEVVLHSGQ